jgi:hypothetical protein
MSEEQGNKRLSKKLNQIIINIVSHLSTQI